MFHNTTVHIDVLGYRISTHSGKFAHVPYFRAASIVFTCVSQDLQTSELEDSSPQ